MPHTRYILNPTYLFREPDGLHPEDGREVVRTYSQTVGLSVAADSTFADAFRAFEKEAGSPLSVTITPDIGSAVPPSGGTKWNDDDF